MTGTPTLLHVFSTFKVGGPQVRFAQLANRFGRSFRHRLLAMDGAYDCRERLDPALDVQILDVPVRKGRTLENATRFRRALRTLRPDLLVTYNWGAIEWAMANWPVLVRHLHVEDGFGPDERYQQLARRVWTRRLFLRRSNVIVPSQVLLNIATTIWHLPVERLRFIANGVDVQKFAPPTHSASRHLPVIGCVAALRKEKNLERLFRAIRLVLNERPVRLIIAGDGPEREPLVALGRELALDVDFLGTIHDAAPIYREFDLLALSSDTEQMPLTVIEAMSSGLPVVATDVGDIKIMVSPENHRFVVGRNETKLALAILDLLNMPNRGVEIGMANRRIAIDRFSEDGMLVAYGSLFGELLGDGRHLKRAIP